MGIEKNRLAAIDILKGIGIVLVVLGHTVHNELNAWIYTFHMPLFFIFAGLFLKPGNDVYLKRLKSMLIPYFIFVFITYPYWRFVEMRFRPLPDGFDANAHFFDIFWQTNEFMFNAVLWFLPCLFITIVLLNFILTIVKNRYAIICLCLAWIVAATLYIPDTQSYWIKETWVAFPFVTIGWILGNSLSRIENKLTTIPWYFKIIALIPLIAVFFIPHGGSMMTAECPIGYVYFFALAFVCVTAVYILSTMLTSQKWLSWLGRNTLVIMCLHEPLKRIVIKVFSTLTHQSTDELRESVILSILVTAVVILALVPVCKLINKRMQWILGRF